MNCFEFNNFRQSAPTDGRNPSTNDKEQSIFLTSKQNSDAKGMFYQWGRKDPFTFATSSEQWGGSYERGKYPIKIYTIDGVLIYQDDIGGNNTDKQPAGGIMLSTLATSMMETIKKPITFYADYTIINQTGHTKELWNYYWISYSRGVDGVRIITNWHNSYLNGYTSQRLKSIYDPCPYGFRLCSNGSYNNLSPSLSWAWGSCTGGIIVNNITWMNSTGIRIKNTLSYTGWTSWHTTATLLNSYQVFTLSFLANGALSTVSDNQIELTKARSVRCIDFARLVSPPRLTGETRL